MSDGQMSLMDSSVTKIEGTNIVNVEIKKENIAALVIYLVAEEPLIQALLSISTMPFFF